MEAVEITSRSNLKKRRKKSNSLKFELPKERRDGSKQESLMKDSRVKPIGFVSYVLKETRI